MSAKLTNDEIIQLLNKVAAEKGDAFRIKVQRFTRGGSMPVQALTVDEAQVSHAANPETWLQRLIGGGPYFMLHVYHMTDTTLPIGQGLTYQFDGPPKSCDFSILRDPAYDGPKTITFPKEETPQQIAAYGVPGPSAPLPFVPPNTNALGGSGSQGPSTPPPGFSSAERDVFIARERSLMDQIHRIELDASRRDAESRAAALEARLEAKLIAAQASRPSDHALPAPKPLTETIAALGTAFGPVLAELMKSNFEMRQLMFKAQQDQAARTELLIEKLLTRPSVDPILERLIDKKSSEEAPNVKMISQMAEAMGGMMGLVTDAVRTITDLGQPEKEPVALTVTKEIGKAIMAVGGAAQAAKIARLPQGAAPAATFAEAQPPRAQPVQGDPQIVDKLEAAVRSYQDPGQLAIAFVNALRDPYLQAALDQYGRNPVNLFQQRLGTWLTEKPENGQYAGALFHHINQQLQAAGLIGPTPVQAPVQAIAPQPPAPAPALVVDSGEDDEEAEEEEEDDGEETEVEETAHA